MPTSLPVPSKGALRALRKLALGTSCTVAFGAGLLTEDRRRRIHSAREVHDNAKKLKSSRKYHSVGTTALEAFEDQTLRYRDEAFWLPSNVLRSAAARAVDSTSLVDSPQLEPPVATGSKPGPLEVPRYIRQESTSKWKPPRTIASHPLVSQISEHPKVSKQQSHNLQRKLAIDITKLLDQDTPKVDQAANRFFEASDEGLYVAESGILQALLDASIKLSNACRKQTKLEMSARVFDIVLSHGAIAEDDYHQFRPADVMQDLLRRETGGGSLLDPANLRKACSIYLTKFKEKPQTMSPRMFSIGDKLCQETCRSGLFDLTLSIYSRLESCRNGRPLIAVDHLITATYGKRHHKKMFRYFQRFYTQTNPDQTQFFHVTSLVIDSMLVLGQLDKAEEVLVVATAMAESRGLRTSTTWLLRVFGEEWRSNHDIVRVQTLFRRLEPLLPLASHPQAFYGAMIQYCVEAREEDLASSYYNELRKSHKPSPEDLRIYGHFALAKAYREDWDGVKEDFVKMRQVDSCDDAVYSAVFTPILKEYSKKHSVSEIEDFIRYFLVRTHMKTTSQIMNVMVNVYSKAHEVDAVSRWINYAVADGCAVDATTFNIILKSCAYTFQFSFNEVYELYTSVRDLGPHFVNNNTLKILRSIALSRSSNQTEMNMRLKMLKSFDDQVKSADSNEVYRAMSMTFAKDNYVAVLKIYKRAQEVPVSLGPGHLLIAVKSSLHLHGQHINETARLIQEAKRRGEDIQQAVSYVFVHQMSELYDRGSSASERMTELAQRTISAFEATGIIVPQPILTHTASVLQRQGRHRLAIDFWDSMSHRLSIPPSSFDLPSLTTLLQAYLGLRDLVGIRWVMKLLSANNLTPDKQFRQILKNTRKETIHRIESNLSSSDMLYKFLDVVEEACQVVKEIRLENLVDRTQARVKVIKIMETAIEEQVLRGRTGRLVEAKELGRETHHEISSEMGHGFRMESNWRESNIDSTEIVDMPSQRLVGAIGV